MDQEDLRTADDLDAVLLSELSPRSLGDNLLVNGEPQQVLRRRGKENRHEEPCLEFDGRVCKS